jgi:hypothetical protein
MSANQLYPFDGTQAQKDKDNAAAEALDDPQELKGLWWPHLLHRARQVDQVWTPAHRSSSPSQPTSYHVHHCSEQTHQD